LVLSYLDSIEIIYPDLKSKNVFFDLTGHIQLTDFGFSEELIANDTAVTFCRTYEN
jgi:serine/threonine protein kinase